MLVAVSGGPDSMCLLNSLINLKDKLKIKEIEVAHVNHMLRKEADEETKYVENFCKNKGIPIFTKYVNIKERTVKNKISEELAGREERYKFFDQIAKKEKINKIAIAHNYNDNAETVLMHMLRGSGMVGLCGIEPKRGIYIRPVINCTRDEIEEYCIQNELKPKYDKSNKNNKYYRNRIRNKLIPYIKEEFNPNIIENLNRLSDIVYKTNKYINKRAALEYKEIVLKEEKERIVLSLKEFNNSEEIIKSEILLIITDKLFGNKKGIEKIYIDDIIKLCKNNVGNKYLTPNKNFRISIKSGKVIFEKL